MWKSCRRKLLGSLWALLWGLSAAAVAAPATPHDYARPAEIRTMVVSPGSGHAAALTTNANGRVMLLIINLADPTKRQVIAAYDDVDVRAVSWVNDQRLVYVVQAPGARLAPDGWGTQAVNLDGSDSRALISSGIAGISSVADTFHGYGLPAGWQLLRTLGDGSDDVIVARWQKAGDSGQMVRRMARVNTRDLKLTPLNDEQPAGANGWLFDKQAQLRVVRATVKDRNQLWWKATADASWTLLEEGDALTGQMPEPVALEDDGSLIVSARVQGDTLALHVYDPAKKTLDPQALVGVAGFDVDHALFSPTRGQVIGAPVDAQLPGWVWFDERLAAVQAAVDKALPAGRSNRLLCGRCVDVPRYVVWSAGDRQPGEYYLFDPASGKLSPLALTRPWLKENDQGRRSFHRVNARDGLSLPVVVTHPVGLPADQPAPTVLNVHGGPWEAGADLLWSAEPQFLASRGYRVLEVSFRGTTGLGRRHEQASWGQWGLAMQDDLEDALLWAVNEKLTDPARVCIIGASYGGYAALMGPIRHPDRYQCAVSHVGVTDLQLLYAGDWTDISAQVRTYGFPRLIGDAVKDAEKLRQTSPVHRVADLKVPVLLVQGELDRRVDPEHASRFVRAARRAGVDIERVNYEEGHGFANLDNLVDYWKRLAAFLDRHLKAR